MNPSVPFLRKFFLVVINKLGYGDTVDKSKALVSDKTGVRSSAK